MFDVRKKEMLQGVNFDYLNSFKKLFETYPELNDLIETNQIKKREHQKRILIEHKKKFCN